MITPEIKAKISKVYALINQGATEGEKAAAKKALDRLIEKHNLDGIDLESIDKERYFFNYVTVLEIKLLIQICSVMLEDENVIANGVQYSSAKKIKLQLTKIDYITLTAAYEYFRRHMKLQWKKACAAAVKRCRSAKTRNAKRAELQEEFFNKYCIASKLYKPEELQTKMIDFEGMSKTALINHHKKSKMLSGVEGGTYNKQVSNGLYLES